MTDLTVIPGVQTGGETGITTAELSNIVIPGPRILNRIPKKVPEELIKQAIENNPLETIPRWHFTDQVKASSTFRQGLPELKSSFFQTHFLMLEEMEITFETSEEDAKNKIVAKIQEKPELEKHLVALETCFIAFREVFQFLEYIIEKGRFMEKHLTSVHTICSSYSSLNDVQRAARLMKPIGIQVKYNRERYIFELPTVLPVSNLPEILLAMPVCFIGNAAESVTSDDPRPSDFTKLICDMVGSHNFAWFYQMYNRRDRSISDFKGPDPIPNDYLELRPQLLEHIDLEVITTPYHGIASQEWADPSWQAGIDPIALAIHSDIPFFTIYKRWSGNGIFPLLADLMADTIDYLKKHKDGLRNFVNTPYWYKGNNEERNCLHGAEHELPNFADRLIEQFEQGTVFQFLRG